MVARDFFSYFSFILLCCCLLSMDALSSSEFLFCVLLGADSAFLDSIAIASVGLFAQHTHDSTVC
jgi:hypothetical protein